MHFNKKLSGSKSLRWLALFFGLFILPVGCQVAAHFGNADSHAPWSALRKDSSGQAPDPGIGRAVIQIYSARAARWRGAFGVHTWMAVKKTDENRFTRIEVMGWTVRRGGKAVRVRQGLADGWWYGNRPYLLRDVRGGEEIDALIDRLLTAADHYPYNDVYNVWPGPNSNTFIAWLARQAPELQLELPATAIGKDYLPAWHWLAPSPSGTGGQISISGLGGILIGKEEGLEINLLGLTVGIDLMPLAIKLPGIGRIGWPDSQRWKSLHAEASAF